jgi:beta-1,4-mannosyltransferase
MQYHSLSLSEFYNVNLVGLSGTTCHEKVINNKNITITEISEKYWSWIPRNKLLFLLFAPLKVIIQIFMIFYILFSINRPDSKNSI